jgi:multidrug resistance efflux pump
MTFFETLRKNFLNTLYFAVVFLVALAIATQALARRVNTYEATRKPLFFSVEKERVILSNSVTGRVESVAVVTGQHVRKGDLLVQLADDSMTGRLQALKELAEENISAKTELALLEARLPDYQILAPRDGVIYQIQAAEGSYLTMNSPVLMLFADSNVKIIGTVNQEQYAEIQTSKDMDVYGPRFEQVYKISFEGVGRVQSSNQSEERYEVKFHFSDPNEGAAFIDGEGLEVVAKNTGDEEAVRPSVQVKNLWNKLILGN